MNLLFSIALWFSLVLLGLSASTTTTTDSGIVLSPSCLETQFFDTTRAKCVDCPSGYYPDPSDSTSCLCRGTLSFNGSTLFHCTPCASAQWPTSDFTTCLACWNASTTAPCSCPSGLLLMDRELTGEPLGLFGCYSCATGTIFSKSQNRCIKCPDSLMTITAGKCACPTGYHIIGDTRCIPDSFTPFSDDKITYYNLKNSDGDSAQQYDFTSGTFSSLLDQAIRFCSMQDSVSCQLLANLCVLQHYDDNSVACENFQTISKSMLATNGNSNGFPDWPAGMPWLYYSTSDALTNQSFLSSNVYFSNSSGPFELPLYVSSVSLEGQWLGFQTLREALMGICSDGNEFAPFEFGKITQFSCSIDLSKLTSRTTVFYDLCKCSLTFLFIGLTHAHTHNDFSLSLSFIPKIILMTLNSNQFL